MTGDTLCDDRPAEASDELIWGAEAIGRVINRDPRAVYHLHGKGELPTKSVGGRLCARKSALLAIAD
jgi:hypothetical protein